jgi:hypothetical protein
MAPAMYWRRIVYGTTQWQYSDVMNIAKMSMTNIGLTNIQQQEMDVYVRTSTMLVAVAVIQPAPHIFVVIAMVAANSDAEAHNTINKLDTEIKKFNPA